MVGYSRNVNKKKFNFLQILSIRSIVYSIKFRYFTHFYLMNYDRIIEHNKKTVLDKFSSSNISKVQYEKKSNTLCHRFEHPKKQTWIHFQNQSINIFIPVHIFHANLSLLAKQNDLSQIHHHVHYMQLPLSHQRLQQCIERDKHNANINRAIPSKGSMIRRETGTNRVRYRDTLLFLYRYYPSEQIRAPLLECNDRLPGFLYVFRGATSIQ